MHKRMNGRQFRGVDIRIPLNPNQDISYPRAKSKDAEKILREIKRTFKKRPEKVHEMAKTIADIISRYTSKMTASNSHEFFENSAIAIAKHFNLEQRIANMMRSEIENQLSFIITSHYDENGKLYYIKQDILRKRIKLGDNLEKINYGNNKFK